MIQRYRFQKNNAEEKDPKRILSDSDNGLSVFSSEKLSRDLINGK